MSIALKVLHLRRLAAGTHSAEEQQSALCEADRLMRKHGLSAVDIEDMATAEAGPTIEPAGQWGPEALQAAGLLSGGFGDVVRQSGSGGLAVAVASDRINAAVAAKRFAHLTAEMRRLVGLAGLLEQDAEAFHIGLAIGLYPRLQAAKPIHAPAPTPPPPDCAALIRGKPEARPKCQQYDAPPAAAPLAPVRPNAVELGMQAAASVALGPLLG